ncbi:MAG: hypothetical protein IH950_00715 [Bacteroidetes bacterium]|nr:hypothetical protein [Bacteroidota bacterium]
MELQNYDPAMYKLLPDVGQAFNEFTKTGIRLQSVGKIIRSHRLEGIVGLCLLHSHFEIAVTERLIQAHVGSQLRTTPREIEDNLVEPYIWKFSLSHDGAGSKYMITPMEFVDKNLSLATSYFTILMEKQDFLDEVADELSKLNMLDRIGICLLHECETLGIDSGVVIETIHIENERAQVLEAADKSTEISSLIPTLWTFKEKSYGRFCKRCVPRNDHHG